MSYPTPIGNAQHLCCWRVYPESHTSMCTFEYVRGRFKMNVLDDQCSICVKSRGCISVCHVMDRNVYWGKSGAYQKRVLFRVRVCVRACAKKADIIVCLLILCPLCCSVENNWIKTALRTYTKHVVWNSFGTLLWKIFLKTQVRFIKNKSFISVA